MKDARARCLLRARDRSLWIGTNGSGIYHITPSGTQHFDVSSGLPNSNVRSLTEASDGTLWIGTDNGLSHLEGNSLHNFTVGNGLAYNVVRAVIEDAAGDIWIGTDHGVSHLHGGSFVSDAATRALSNEQVWSLLADTDGGIWFGTQGGGLYSYSRGTIAHFTTAMGLVSDSIYSVIEDGKNRLWLSTPSAVMLLDRKDLTHRTADGNKPIPMRIFSENVGGRPAHFYGGNQPSGVVTRSGDGCFPSSNGLWIIHPDMNIEPYRVHINVESFNVDGHDLPVNDTETLAAGANRIEIVYGLEMLGSQQEWRFRYKLDGFDHDWVQGLFNRRGVSYTNIPPGRYQFEVESWSVYQPERKVRASFTLIKKPFIYQTLWFRIAVVLAIIALIVIAVYMRIANINSRFRSIIAERTRIAREMHDTLLQGCAGVSALLHAAAGDDLGDSSTRLHLIQHASTQIRATMDEARQAIWSLRSEVPTSLDLIQSIQQITERIWRAYGMEAVLAVNGVPSEMNEATVRALTMIVREAVFNAILHANAQSIRVELTYSPGGVTIAIVDDGQGFAVNASPADDDYGIMGMRERADSLRGKLTIESTPGRGTTVLVKVPTNPVDTAAPDLAMTSKG
jgi:signal transduction histidine kinase